jgi:hypothetical protein
MAGVADSRIGGIAHAGSHLTKILRKKTLHIADAESRILRVSPLQGVAGPRIADVESRRPRVWPKRGARCRVWSIREVASLSLI